MKEVEAQSWRGLREIEVSTETGLEAPQHGWEGTKGYFIDSQNEAMSLEWRRTSRLGQFWLYHTWRVFFSFNRLGFCASVSYLSHHCHKTPRKNNLGTKRMILSYNHMVKMAWLQEPEVDGLAAGA